MSEHCCLGCQTPGVDPYFPVCDAWERRYPRLLISAALAAPKSREVYLARLTTGETVRFRYAALDGDYVRAFETELRCNPETRVWERIIVREVTYEGESPLASDERKPRPPFARLSPEEADRLHEAILRYLASDESFLDKHSTAELRERLEWRKKHGGR
jgi:hypothetical protein